MHDIAQVAPQRTEPLIPEEGSLVVNRSKIFIAFVVLIGALGYLGFIAFQSATVYYYTVDEIIQAGPTADGKIVRVSGKLVPSSYYREEGSTLAQFDLSDGTLNLQAVHNGVLPNLFFNEHSDIILEGAFTSGGLFESQNVIVKCPSKYVAADESG